MIRGIYTAASGMLAEQQVQDSLAANLANINTAGFKQDIPLFRAMRDAAISRYQNDNGTPVGSMGTGVSFDHTALDMTPGTLANTGSPYDLALVGDGYFVVQTQQGERLTRDGQFHIEPTGKDAAGKPIAYLSDDGGNKVLGVKGPIQVSDTANFAVDGNGNITVNGKAVDQLKLVKASPTSLVKVGGNLYTVNGAVQASTARVKEGSYEQSNVNAVSSMVRLITVQRAYEAAQKAILAQDDSIGKAINEVPKIG